MKATADIIDDILTLLTSDFEEITVPLVMAWIRFHYPEKFNTPPRDSFESNVREAQEVLEKAAKKRQS